MGHLRRRDLEGLLSAHGDCCSILLPMNPTGREKQRDPLRLEQAVDDCEQKLRERGCKAAQVRKILEPVRQLPLTSRWEARGLSVAIFANQNGTQSLSVEANLEPEVWVDDSFHVRQLVPMVIDSERYYLLTLSEFHVQMYEGNAETLTAVELPVAPSHIDEALPIENADRVLQTHSPNVAAFGRNGAIIHGAGGKTNMAQSNLRQYVQRVAEAVRQKLMRRTEPLVVATVAENMPIWKDACRYPHLLEAFVAGNPELVSHHDLHEQAWRLVCEEFDRAKKAARQQLMNLRHTPRAAAGPAQVLQAAVTGRIDTLFVDSRRPVFGSYDAVNATADLRSTPAEGANDLLEAAIRETYQHRGKVVPFDTASMGVEALLRY